MTKSLNRRDLRNAEMFTLMQTSFFKKFPSDLQTLIFKHVLEFNQGAMIDLDLWKLFFSN